MVMNDFKLNKINIMRKERFFTINKDGKVEILWLDDKQQIELYEEIRKSMEKERWKKER